MIGYETPTCLNIGRGSRAPRSSVFCQIEAVQQNGAAPIGLTSIEQTQLACEIPIIPHIPSQERLFLRDISCESEVGGEKLHVSMPAWLEGHHGTPPDKSKIDEEKNRKTNVGLDSEAWISVQDKLIDFVADMS